MSTNSIPTAMQRYQYESALAQQFRAEEAAAIAYQKACEARFAVIRCGYFIDDKAAAIAAAESCVRTGQRCAESYARLAAEAEKRAKEAESEAIAEDYSRNVPGHTYWGD